MIQFIYVLVFEEIKIYQCAKGDTDQQADYNHYNNADSKKGEVMPIIIMFFSIFNERLAVTSPHTMRRDVT